NDTIAYNGPLGVVAAGAAITNTIIWGHTTDLDTPVAAVSYSDIGQSGYSGVNHNLSVDPLLADLAHLYVHLPPTSPVLDAGNTASPNLPATDYDGDPRLVGVAVDIGADETESATLTLNKSALPAGTLYPGNLVTYTLSLSNLGPASAAGVL